MPTERADALKAVGLYGKFNQRPGAEGRSGPFWYGQVVAVDLSGDYLQLDTGGSRRRLAWVHRRDVHLHEHQQDNNAD